MRGEKSRNKMCLYLLGGSSRDTDSSDKQKMFKVKYSRKLSRHYRLLCILNLYDVWLRTRQIILEELSDPLLLFIFKFKSIFRERQQIAVIFNEF